MEVTLKLAGAKPLLLSSIDAADPRSRAYRKMAELRKIKSANRTPKWYDDMEWEQFLSSFYTIPEVAGVAIPAENVRRSLIEAAKADRSSPKAKRANWRFPPSAFSSATRPCLCAVVPSGRYVSPSSR